MRTIQSWTCELGYGADTMFHRTYFLYIDNFDSIVLCSEALLCPGTIVGHTLSDPSISLSVCLSATLFHTHGSTVKTGAF